MRLHGVTLALALMLLAGCSDPSAPSTTDAATTESQPGAAADPTLPGAPVTADGLVGRWFAPTAPGPQPALLVLGGSEGGLATVSRMGEGLHAQGYAVLSLGYFGVEGLPAQLQEIPLEYFVRGLDWLAAQPGVDPARIGVVGGSKGAEAALLLASRDARVRAVVASTPTDHAWQSVDWNGWSDTPSWTEGGQPVAYLRYAPFDMAAGLRAMYDRSVAEAAPEAREAARIPLERSNAALLLIAGEADGLWGAAEAAQRIAYRLAASNHPRPVQVLRYPDAGHVVFIGRTLAADDPLLARFEGMGGTPEGTRAAINDAWPKSLAFLADQLGGTAGGR
jgi:dienelactone hydrolase